MCQGVIVSLVKFQNKSGTQEELILSGIGSHSTMFQENKDFLVSKGWIESSGNESIISIESDFTKGWNHSAIESGEPTNEDLELLKKEYKRIAGGPKELIEHVTKCKKIDNALLQLLTPEAWKQYDEAVAPIRKQYNEALVPIWKQYNEAVAPIWKQRDEAEASIWKQYNEAEASIRKQRDEAEASIWKQYDEAEASIRKQYNEAEASIWKQYNEAVAPIWKQYNEAEASIRKQYNEALAPIWIELFQITENRIEILK